ncbi:hypothetical protein IGI04_020057 [Brassica rapa subsp. trilocularis]|uniref:Secreted protein n=1 Tax=Brassica rapa subsp. trilocularis TaxID=1813537 RepID=A0ABQ7MHN2_BRACM|nr:hypothetical protein IGI04_020057 [Brassica rapa subsp. trilocularis]
MYSSTRLSLTGFLFCLCLYAGNGVSAKEICVILELSSNLPRVLEVCTSAIPQAFLDGTDTNPSRLTERCLKLWYQEEMTKMNLTYHFGFMFVFDDLNVPNGIDYLTAHVEPEVLDLDPRLLHTTHLPRLTEAEKYLIKEAASITRDDLRKWNADCDDPMVFLTKLRPFVHDFLEEANKIFTIYTKGISRLR